MKRAIARMVFGVLFGASSLVLLADESTAQGPIGRGPCYECEIDWHWFNCREVSTPGADGMTGCMAGGSGCELFGSYCEEEVTMNVGPDGRARPSSSEATGVATVVAMLQESLGEQRVCNGAIVKRAYIADAEQQLMATTRTVVI